VGYHTDYTHKDLAGHLDDASVVLCHTTFWSLLSVLQFLSLLLQWRCTVPGSLSSNNWIYPSTQMRKFELEAITDAGKLPYVETI